MSEPINIPIEKLSFRPTGSDNDPRSRLLATICIGGLPCHLEAIAVTDHEEHGQVATDPEFDDILNEIYLAAGPDSPFRTIEIDGREYVFFLTPHA